MRFMLYFFGKPESKPSKSLKSNHTVWYWISTIMKVIAHASEKGLLRNV